MDLIATCISYSFSGNTLTVEATKMTQQHDCKQTTSFLAPKK